MPDTPKPGRILPAESYGKISKGTSTAGNVKDITKMARDPVETTKELSTGKVAQRSLAVDTRKRFNKALSKAHQTGVAPRGPKYRISLFEGGIVMAFCFIADLVEFVIGLFVVTEPIVLVIDVVIGLIMTAWLALYHKVPFASHWQRYASLLVAFIGEAIPYVDICSFWFFDAWYIVSSIRKEDKQMHDQLMQTLNAERQEQERQEWMENYEQQQAMQEEEVVV